MISLRFPGIAQLFPKRKNRDCGGRVLVSRHVHFPLYGHQDDASHGQASVDGYSKIFVVTYSGQILPDVHFLISLNLAIQGLTSARPEALLHCAGIWLYQNGSSSERALEVVKR